MNEWKTIDSAPTDGTPILLLGKLCGEINGWRVTREIVVGSFSYGRWSMDNTDTYGVDCEPTHWQPLPTVPDGL